MPEVLTRNDSNLLTPSYSNVNAGLEDKEAARDEELGTISQREINDIGGDSQILDNKAGVQTRGIKNDAMKAERDVDAAVDSAIQYDYETGGQKVR